MVSIYSSEFEGLMAINLVTENLLF